MTSNFLAAVSRKMPWFIPVPLEFGLTTGLPEFTASRYSWSGIKFSAEFLGWVPRGRLGAKTFKRSEQFRFIRLQKMHAQFCRFKHLSPNRPRGLFLLFPGSRIFPWPSRIGVMGHVPKANSAFHPSGVGKWVPPSAEKAKAGMAHSISGWTRGVQVKLWDPSRTRAIPERLRGVFTTRRYTNPRLPLPAFTPVSRGCSTV